AIRAMAQSRCASRFANVPRRSTQRRSVSRNCARPNRDSGTHTVVAGSHAEPSVLAQLGCGIRSCRSLSFCPRIPPVITQATDRKHPNINRARSRHGSSRDTWQGRRTLRFDLPIIGTGLLLLCREYLASIRGPRSKCLGESWGGSSVCSLLHC